MEMIRWTAHAGSSSQTPVHRVFVCVRIALTIPARNFRLRMFKTALEDLSVYEVNKQVWTRRRWTGMSWMSVSWTGMSIGKTRLRTADREPANTACVHIVRRIAHASLRLTL